jgi:hypothetical protein
MSLTTKTLEHVVLAYNLPRGRAVVDRGKVAEAPQETAEAVAPHAALAAQPSEAALRVAGVNSISSATERLAENLCVSIPLI